MPADSPQETGLGGLKRINTNVSEGSGRLKSGASGRLSLHIPNAYPRSFSPRSSGSKNGTPQSSRPPSPRLNPLGNSTADRPTGTVKQSGSTNVRTIREDSSLITIQHTDGDNTGDDACEVGRGTEAQLSSTTLNTLGSIKRFFQTKETSSSSARDFLARERNFFSWLRLSCLLAILSASLILQLQLPDTARTYSSTPRKRGDEPVDWDHLPISTKVFAGMFFALSILSLFTGVVDYLRAERGLEEEQVDFDETEGVFLNDGHTSRSVHAVMMVVGAGIIASALWLLAY